MNVRILNSARVYLRRSTSNQESSLEMQLNWAIDAAKRVRIPLRASMDDVTHMQSQRLNHYKDIYLDDAISGSRSKRPAFDAMNLELQTNTSVSHLFVFKRDRLGRPKDPVDMLVVERDLLALGVTCVMSDCVRVPGLTGNAAAGQTIIALVGYSESGGFSRILSERVILTQTSLAAEGYSTGGRPPYGHGRFLCDSNGEVLEQLHGSRSVRQKGCHVRIQPNDPVKIGIWVQILEWLENEWGYKRVANELNRLGIPSPDRGRKRRDDGIEHEVSGKWNHNTVKSLAENPIITGIKVYGRLSEGVHHRIASKGHRPVEPDDILPDGSGRIIANDPSIWIQASSGGGIAFDPERWNRLQLKLQGRSTSEAGKRKAPNPAAYPLSPRVFDLTDNCGSLMYGTTRKKGDAPTYRCGAYMKSQGQQCHHNNVDAEALLRLTIGTIVRTVERAGGAVKLRAALEARAMAAETQPLSPNEALRAKVQERVCELQRQVERTPRRILEVEDEGLCAELQATYRKLQADLAEENKVLASFDARLSRGPDKLNVETELQKALGLIQHIETIVADPVARGEIPKLLSALGIRIGLTFREGHSNKRRVRKLLGGVIAFGNRPLTCVLRSGTGRPLPGGLAANANPDHNSGCQHSHHANVPPEATRFEGDKKVPSKRKGKSTEKRGLSRGGKPNSSIDSNPRQPPENGWLSKVSRGDPRRYLPYEMAF